MSIICPECNKDCLPVEQDDSFSYSGTHCTNGLPGTCYIPVIFVSSCCEAYLESYLIEPPDYHI